MPEKQHPTGSSPRPDSLVPGPGLEIRFWGTRGTVAPEQNSPAFGIHTTSVEVKAGGNPSFFVDFGTGVVGAGNRALARGIREFDFWLTHLHSDHVSGMYAFTPLYRADCTVRIFSAVPEFESALKSWFAPPYHPLSFDDIAAKVVFRPLPECGERLFPGHGFHLRWGPVPHPQPCTSLRFEADGNVFVFGTDVEIRADGHGGDLLRLLGEPSPAGLAAIDGFFMDSEIHKYPDWGHSSWKEAWELCRKAGVETLVVTHHHPANDEGVLRAIEAATPASVHWARESVAWRLEHNHARCL